MTESLYEFKKNLAHEGVIVCFSSIISQGILSNFASIIEKKLESMESSAVTQNIFAIFVEMAQNIISYSSDSVFVGENEKQSPGIMVVGYDQQTSKYYVKSGNTVLASTMEKITKRIEDVKNLDKDELKALYKERRKSGRDTHGRGGGLGFLEIQKKASAPIEYSFDKIDEQQLFFSLKANI